MKSIFQLSLVAVLTCGIALIGQPSLADWRDAKHEYKEAREDSHDAYKAQVKANRSARKGHRLSSYLHSRHAAHERARAAKHRREAQRERWDH